MGWRPEATRVSGGGGGVPPPVHAGRPDIAELTAGRRRSRGTEEQEDPFSLAKESCSGSGQVKGSPGGASAEVLTQQKALDIDRMKREAVCREGREGFLFGAR